MRCLTDVDLQVVVDDEATEAVRAHVAACHRCGDRIEERRLQMAQLATIMETAGDIPPIVEARLRHALTVGRSVRGATALRAPASTPSRHRVGWASAFATAVVVVLIVFLVLPRFGAPTSLSASQILGRSLQTLSNARGIEQLEYELLVTGMPDGMHRIEQLIDHDHPSRYRLANYGPDGALQSAISQDPFSGRRTQLIRVDGRNYVVNVRSPGGSLLSLPQMAQAQIETVITMMQATSDQKLTIQDAPDGRQYIIQMPPVTPKASAGMFDLYQARAVIDASDFRIREFQASGALLKQPYSVSFKLIRQSLRQPADVAPAEFEIATSPGDVVFEGEATSDPLTDMLTTLLRELGRAKGI